MPIWKFSASCPGRHSDDTSAFQPHCLACSLFISLYLYPALSLWSLASTQLGSHAPCCQRSTDHAQALAPKSPPPLAPPSFVPLHRRSEARLDWPSAVTGRGLRANQIGALRGRVCVLPYRASLGLPGSGRGAGMGKVLARQVRAPRPWW